MGYSEYTSYLALSQVKEKGASQGLSGGYLEDEDDDEEGAVSIAKIKAKYKSGGGAGEKKKPIYSDSDSDMEERKEKRLQKEAFSNIDVVDVHEMVLKYYDVDM